MLLRIPVIIRSIVEDHKNIEQIANDFGLNKSTIYRTLEHIEPTSFTNPLYAETLAEIRKILDPKERLPLQLKILGMIVKQRVETHIEAKQPIVIEMFQREMPKEEKPVDT